MAALIEQKYVDSSLSGSPTTDDFKYGYDADGNVLYRQNVNTANSTTTQDELYQYDPSGDPPADGSGYDALNQLTGFERGTLTASISGGTLDTISSPSASDSWSLDALGNWDAESVNGSFPAHRTFDSRNQNESDTYDSNGNVLDDGINTYTYDAWNRMATYSTDDGGFEGRTYTEEYDALGRRIIEDFLPAGGGLGESGGVGSHPTYTALYYSSADQVVEEQAFTSTGTHKTTTNVWGQQYVNDLVEQDVHQVTGSTDHYYAQHDANFDVTALISGNSGTVGQVLERYEYDPYGRVTFLSPGWSTRSESSYGMQYLFQGMRYDATSGLFHADARDYSTALGTWTEEDPQGYINSSNLYEFDASDAVCLVDPTGQTLEICTRAAWQNHFGANSPLTHAFLYDPSDNFRCGQQGSFGSGGNMNTPEDTGYPVPNPPVRPVLHSVPQPTTAPTTQPTSRPTGTICFAITDADGFQLSAAQISQIKSCCSSKFNKGPFIPGVKDCHTLARNCITDNGGVVPPGISRINPTWFSNLLTGYWQKLKGFLNGR